MRIDQLYQELEQENNLFTVTNGIVDSPYDLNEDVYYYYLIPHNNSYKLVPVQVVGGIIQELKTVDGKVDDTSTNLNNVKKIFSLSKEIKSNELRKLLEEQNILYDRNTYQKFIETAKKYKVLRNRLISKIFLKEKDILLYQGDKELLPSTKSSFSLGYNEDAYIKSSIAYEIEMYMRSILSKYGILDQDLREVFNKHNLKEAFLKFPRTERTRIYKLYKEEYKRKTLSINEKLIEEILKSENVETICRTSKKLGVSTKKELEIVLEEFLLQLQKENQTEEDIRKIEKLKKYLKFVKEETAKEYNNISENLLKERFDVSSYDRTNDKETKNEYKNLTSKTAFEKYLGYFKYYKKYEKYDSKYEELLICLTSLNQKIKLIREKVNELEREKRKQDNIYKNRGFYTVAQEEYNNIIKELSECNKKILEMNDIKKIITTQIAAIEEKMIIYIFDDSLKMETAYQDNRYPYEDEANNNFDNMNIFLNVIKKVVLDLQEREDDYDTIYRKITLKQKNRKNRSVILATNYEITNFEQIFSRKDERFTCKGRKTKEGIISRFFKSKKEPKLDAIYTAELKYLGSLLVRENNNLFTSEAAIACELYLKSMIRSHETTHSLKELYLKLDNKTKSIIVRKVNSISKMNFTKNEFLRILGKKEIDNAFSEYRYLYEKEVKQEDLEFIKVFAQVLHEVAAKKTNYKSPYYETINKELEVTCENSKKNN